MSRDFKVAVSVLLVAAVGYWAFVPRGPGAADRQRSNLAVAEEEIPRVRAALDADPRFREVEMGRFTSQDGGIAIMGGVESDDDLFRLMKAVAALQLRVPVFWRVQVLPKQP